MPLNARKPWLNESTVLPIPASEAIAILRDPDTVPDLFPEFGIEVEPHDRVDIGTRLHLARVALDHNVTLHVAQLETEGDDIAKILLELERSRLGQGTTIESGLGPHQSNPDTSRLDFRVFPPPEGGLVYRMPFGRRMVSGAIQHELRHIPDRFEQIRNRPAA